jgi:Tfp pilus assembly protein PilO
VLSEQRKPLLVLLVALVVNAAVYAALVYPLSKAVSEADVRAAAAEQLRATAARELALARAVSSGKQLAEGELRTFYEEVLPSNLSAAQNATYLTLSTLARNSNLRLTRRTVRTQDARRGSLDRFEIAIVLEGDYANVRRFIHTLETAPEFIVIDEMSIEQGRTEGSQLTLTLTAATYYRTTSHGS